MKITRDNIIDLILNAETRRKLWQAIAEERNIKLHTINSVFDAIYDLDFITDEEFIQIKNILLNEGEIGEDILDCFVSSKYFPEQLLYELLDKNKCISALCHKREQIDLLLKLIEKYDDCSEAIITIGIHYYNSKNISKSTFNNFILKYKQHSWLLSSLTNQLNETNPKTKHIINLLQTDEFEKKNIEKYLERSTATNLLTTKDVEFIVEKFNTNNPMFWHSIFQNPNTLIYILQKLSAITEIKHSKKIRSNSLANLNNRA